MSTLDDTTRILARLAARISFDQLSPKLVDETTKKLVDTMGCALGGLNSEPAQIACRLASRTSGAPSADVIGTSIATSMDMAAFANAAMIRYLDYNDTFISIGAGHPSDMVSAVLAGANAFRRSGQDFMAGVVAAYEVFGALARIIPIRQRGWDQGVFIVLGGAAGAAKMMGLSEEQIAHALSIGVTAHVPTRQTRSGELSMWKGCATAAAARGGVFAAQLAAEGMTGPTAAFEGRHGIWEQVTGPFTLHEPAETREMYAIEESNLKYFPSEYHSQAPLWLALSIRDRVPPDFIRAITISTYHVAFSEIGSEPEKWRPQTRETADHSLPFLFATALRYGALTSESFSQASIADPITADLMGRITVREEPHFTARYPQELVSEIEVETTDGRHVVERVAFPRGHRRNPMSKEEVANKFRTLAANVLDGPRAEHLLDTLWNLPTLSDVSSLFALARPA